MSDKSIMSVDVECPICDKPLAVPFRLVPVEDGKPVIEPDYSAAQRHVKGHGNMILPASSTPTGEP